MLTNNAVKALSTLVLLLCMSFARSQTTSASGVCRKQLLNTFSAERKCMDSIFKAGKAWQIKYSCSSEVRNPNTKKYQLVNTFGELMAAKNVRYKKSKNIEVFADEHDIFTVNGEMNTILHTLTSKNDMAMRSDAYTSVMEDSIFKLMTITSCNTIQKGNRTSICYNLVATSKRSPYSKASIFADPNSLLMQEVRVDLNQDYQSEIKQYTFTITDRREYKLEPYWKCIKKKFLDNANKLKAPYNSYTLVDASDRTETAKRLRK